MVVQVLTTFCREVFVPDIERIVDRLRGSRAPVTAIAIAVTLSLAGVARAGTGVWQTGGPFGGDVTAFAIDPQTPTTLYAAAGGRVFKSIDAGETWLVAYGGHGSTINLLVVIRTTPATLYAASLGGGVGNGGTRIVRSTDAGATWASVVPSGGPFPILQLQSLAIDPVTPATLYVGARVQAPSILSAGVFKSTDSGSTWSYSGLLSALGVGPLAVNPAKPSRVYAATPVELQSDDGGVTWNPAGSGPGAASMSAVAYDPSTPTILYAPTATGVLKSTDGGISWVAANAGLTTLDIKALVVDRTTPTTIHAATCGGVFTSTDSAGTWVQIATVSFCPPIAFDPATPATLYGWGPPGFFKSTNSGSTWVALNRGLGLLGAGALAIDPTSPATAYAATRGGMFKSTDRGATWVAANTGLPDPATLPVTAVAIDPVTPTTLYAGAAGGVYKSINAGGTWTLASVLGVDFLVLGVDPATPAILYAGGRYGLFKSTDGGGAWVPASMGLPDPALLAVTALANDPATPTTLYAGTSAGVFKSTDGGGLWTPASNGLTNTMVLSLAIDPGSSAAIYAGTSGGGVFRSTDSGVTWSGVGPANSSIPAIVIAPPSTLYAGTTTGGVLMSTTSGGNWTAFNQGLPPGSIQALALDPTGATTLYAGLESEGVWQFRNSTGAFQSVAPCRAIDTRASDSPALAAGGARTFTLAGKCGIPTDAGNISLNVTAVGATSPGHLRIYPAASALPPNSSLNYAAGQTRANNAVSLLGAAGDLSIFAAQASGSVDVIVDVNGYYR